jgi:hypothetical protein
MVDVFNQSDLCLYNVSRLTNRSESEDGDGMNGWRLRWHEEPPTSVRVEAEASMPKGRRRKVDIRDQRHPLFWPNSWASQKQRQSGPWMITHAIMLVNGITLAQGLFELISILLMMLWPGLPRHIPTNFHHHVSP